MDAKRIPGCLHLFRYFYQVVFRLISSGKHSVQKEIALWPRNMGCFQLILVGFGKIKPIWICPVLDEKLKIPSQIVWEKRTLEVDVFLISRNKSKSSLQYHILIVSSLNMMYHSTDFFTISLMLKFAWFFNLSNIFPRSVPLYCLSCILYVNTCELDTKTLRLI